MVVFKMLKAILFDLFRTLTTGGCDPRKDIVSKFKLSIDHTTLEKVHCGTKFTDWDSYLKGILDFIKIPNTEENKTKLRTVYEKDSKKYLVLDGVKEVLEEIKSMNLGLGLISNFPNDYYRILERANLGDLFDTRIYSHEVGFVKPSKEIFQIALDGLNVKPQEALMIGDSLDHDIEGAERVGIHTLLADYNGKHPNYEGHRVTSVRDIPKHIRERFNI